ncbi:hypothetical protein Tco_0744538 [Tanacetum coccineum]
MGDENPIHTLGDYYKPSHEGYRNTIELLEGNNVVPLRSDTISHIGDRRHIDARKNQASTLDGMSILAPKQPTQVKKSLLHVRSVVFPTTLKDISSIIDSRLSQVGLGKPFVKISNVTHDPPEGVVKFTNGTDEIAYKMPNKIEQYNSLSDLEKEHTKSVYFRNEEDKRRGVEYVMRKILRFYKECLELGPEYLTRIADEGGVT